MEWFSASDYWLARFVLVVLTQTDLDELDRMLRAAGVGDDLTEYVLEMVRCEQHARPGPVLTALGADMLGMDMDNRRSDGFEGMGHPCGIGIQRLIQRWCGIVWHR